VHEKMLSRGPIKEPEAASADKVEETIPVRLFWKERTTWKAVSQACGEEGSIKQIGKKKGNSKSFMAKENVCKGQGLLVF